MRKRATSPKRHPSLATRTHARLARLARRARPAARKIVYSAACAAAALAYAACDGDKRITSPLSPNAALQVDIATEVNKYDPDPIPETLYPPTAESSPVEDGGGDPSVAPSSLSSLSAVRSLSAVSAASEPVLAAAATSSVVFDPALGTNLRFTDDECSIQPIGFTFMFFGRSYTNAGVAANGQIVLNRCSERFTGTLGPIGNTEVEIAPGFGDWVMQSLRGGDPASNVYVQRVGTAPNRRFIVTWNRVSVWPNFTLPVVSTFQAQLFEGSNKILFAYNGLRAAPSNIVTGLSSGAGTVVRSAIGLGFFALDQKNLCYVPSGNGHVEAPVSDCLPNRPPRGDGGGNDETRAVYTGVEGLQVRFAGSGSDPDGDDISYAWDFDGDGDVDATVAAAGFTYADNGSYVARLTVTDFLGLSFSVTVPVTITNVAPTVSAGEDIEVTGGTPAVVDATFTDPGVNDNDWTFSVDWGDGSPATTGSISRAGVHIQGAHVYATSGVYTVKVTVTDKDGGVGTATFRAVVANRAPTAHAGGNNTAGDTYLGVEGVDVAFNGSGADADGDPLTYSWSFGDGASGTGQSATHRYGDNGTYTGVLTVTDSHGASASSPVEVTITNLPPTAKFGQPPSSLKEGSELSLSLTEPQDVAADLASLTYAFDCGAGYGSYGTTPRMTCETADDGTLAVRAKIRDKDGGESEYVGSVAVVNVAPSGTLAVTAPVDEGTSFTVSMGDAFDPSSADRAAGFTYAFDCGDGTGYQAYSADASASCPTTDNGVRSVRGKIRDKDGDESEYGGGATVNNVAPALEAITLPSDPLAVGSIVRASASFADPGSADTHLGAVQWDIGQTFVAADPIEPGARAVTATSGSLGAGVYTVSLRVRDDDGGEDTETATGYVVVYDPSAGFVTGGGWIWSRTGACQLTGACAKAAGKAHFGFVAKYLPGANTPSGNTEFQFQAGDFRFSSTSYQWLVVSGARAQYKGEGTVNGRGRYRFLLTAVDGQTVGGGGADRFRIRVWAVNADDTDGGVVYDNQPNAADDSEASSVLGGGSIVIHKQ